MRFSLSLSKLRINPGYLFTGLLLVSAPFSVSVFPVIIVYALALAALLFTFPSYIYTPNVDKKLLQFFIFFLSPSIIGMISLFPSIVINPHNLDYNQLSIYGRVFNLTFWLLAIVLIHYHVTKHGLSNLIYWLWWGGLIFIGFGIWHAASIYGLIGSFPFETRSHLHSTGNVTIIAGERVTGVAREPSFFVPFVVDFMILTLLLVCSRIKKLALLLLSLLLIVASLSPSGFMILSGAFLGGFFVLGLRYILSMKLSAQHMFYIGIFFSALAPFFYLLLNSSIWDYILHRFLTVGDSGRGFMVVMPFVWSWESNVFNFLFGNGIKTFSIIGSQFSLPSGAPVHATSNNVFTDMFWEAGLIGFLLLVAFYFYCFFKILTSRFSSFQIFIAGSILFDMFFSGLVRADFASLRVFIMFYLLFLLIHYDMKRPVSALWGR